MQTTEWLKRLPLKELYKRLLTSVEERKRYVYFLRLWCLFSLINPDTLEAERVFSLMNDVMSDLRSRMGAEVVNQIMAWHYTFKDMSDADFRPFAIAIVNRWRENEGPKGRCKVAAADPKLARPAPTAVEQGGDAIFIQ